MDIDVFRPDQLDLVLRVLRTALNAEGPLDDAERGFLDTYATICGRPPLEADPEPIEPQQVVMAGGHRRKRLVQLSAMAVLLARPMRPRSIEFLKLLAWTLTAPDPVIDVIDAVALRKPVKARMLAMRRAMRVMFKEAWLAEGSKGVLRLFAAMALGAAVNKDKLWKYKRLGLLPEGTLGRTYWRHMIENGFGFPGDVAGIADSVAYHDVAHVLAGHDTTPDGEIQQGSFQGGNRREDGFFFVQFVLLQFHHGVKVTPATGPQTGHFDPRKVLWAIHRGAQCSVDMTHQWDFWPLMELPLAEARLRCRLLPERLPVVREALRQAA